MRVSSTSRAHKSPCRRPQTLPSRCWEEGSTSVQSSTCSIVSHFGIRGDPVDYPIRECRQKANDMLMLKVGHIIQLAREKVTKTLPACVTEDVLGRENLATRLII